MIPKCLRLVPVFACLVAPAFAADREAIVTELRDAYAKLDGFVVVYHSEAPGKTLEATVAMDKFSGLGFVRMQATRGSDKLEGRMWNTDDDVAYIDQGRGVVRVQGIMGELKSINELERALNPEKETIVMRLIPGFHLQGTGLFPNFRVSNLRGASWEDLVENAPLHETTDKTAVFSTKEYGLVTVSRENGLMIRQEVDLRNDAKRVLEVRSLQINPGSDAIRKLSAEWSTHGAPSLNPMTYTGPYRLQMFQRLIDKIEGGGDLLKLEEGLEEQREMLRRFADGCVQEQPGSVASRPTWKGFLDQVREQLLKTGRNAEGKTFNADELALELKKPEVRNKTREAIVRFLSPGSSNEMPADEVRDIVMNEIFGKSDKPYLTANGDEGKAAATLIRDALSTAFIEAVADRKMAEYWDKDGSLD